MKGQAFTVFKMLIGAVFAVGLLMLIYAVVSGMNYPISGVEETKNLLLQASRAPTLCFERSVLKFTKDEGFTDESVGFENAVRFIPVVGGIDCPGGRGCDVTVDIEILVSARCPVSGDCTVWFGQPCP